MAAYLAAASFQQLLPVVSMAIIPAISLTESYESPSTQTNRDYYKEATRDLLRTVGAY